MRLPAAAAGEKTGAGAPGRAASLLAVASVLCGCALGPGELGRPRRLPFEAAFENASPVATLAERERDHRLRHFRRAPEALPVWSAAARLNALRDAIETDRSLLPPLAAALNAADDRQRIRAVALAQFPALDPDSRALAGAAIDRQAAIRAELCPLLETRARHYRAALENAVALAPENEAIAAERSLVAFEAEWPARCPRAAPVSPGGRPLSIVRK